MKVFLLEHPRQIAPDRCNDIANAPLSSSLITGNVGGMLAAVGHDVRIAEGFLDGLTYDEIYRDLTAFTPSVLGVHLVYNWENNRQLFSFLKRLKAEGAIESIVGYGYYPTFAYEEIFTFCPEFDVLLIGEPERTFVEWLEIGGPVPGTAWVDGNGQARMRRREVIRDLDSLPDPLRTDAMLRMPEINIEGSRGCYGGCTFCYINPYYGEKSCWRPKTPERVMREIDDIIERYGPRKFYFTDPNFFGPGKRGQERAMKLAALLKERNIRFGIEGRVNDIHQESIAALVEAGLEDLLIGLESGRNESLKRLNKMTTVEQNEKALAVLRHNGLEPNVGFIMFEPDSEPSDIRLNFEFLKRNDLLKNIHITANVLYHPQIILQGTTAYQALQREGRLILRNTTYEGMMNYSVPEVACLAQIIGRITNHFFVNMNRVWKGALREPADVAALYAEVNETMVDCFEDTLCRLEAGETVDESLSQAIMNKAMMRIDSVFKRFPKAKANTNDMSVQATNICTSFQ